MRRVLGKAKYKILLVLTGSLLVFFIFSNTVSMGILAGEGELEDIVTEGPTDEVQMQEFESDDSQGGNGEEPNEEETVIDTVDDDTPVVDSGEGGEASGDDPSSEGGTGEEGEEGEEGAAGSGDDTDPEDPENEEGEENANNNSEDECICTTACTEDEVNGECPVCSKDYTKCSCGGAESESGNEIKCTCTTHCTAQEFDETCPICGEDFEQCAIPGDDECTCKFQCTEDRVDEECPVCAKDYTKCTCTKPWECTCEVKCEEGEVDLSCPVCAEDITLCEGDELQYAAIIHYTLDGESKRAKYITLAEAINGASAVASLVHENGDSNYTPTIVIQDELTIASTITTSNSTTYTIDMRGHRILLQSGVYIDFGSSTVTLTDSTASPINYSGSNSKPGGITGENGKLLSGTGSVTFASGYYSISSGNVVYGFSNVTANGAFLLTSSGALANDVGSLTINGGFFVYDTVFGTGEGSLNLPGQNVLSDLTLTIDSYDISGHALSTAIFKVTLALVGNPEYSFTTFAEAFDGAKSLSEQNDGAKATITINDPNIVNVAVSRNYVLSGGESFAPVVEINAINFIRGGQSESLYDGTMFSVNGGELILNNCNLNGYISEDQVAVSSMVTVDSGAKLTLIGDVDVGTALTGNVALYGATAGDPCAGVFVKNGGVVGFKGYVSILNNVTYSESTDDLGEIVSNKINKNLYLDETARIDILGVMLRTESFLIGVTTGVELDDDLTVGYLENSYISELNGAGISVVDLTSFYSDTSAAYFFVYDFETNIISMSRGSALLPEAGVLRVEFIILLIGLIGFILKNLDKFQERVEIERYITVVSVICLVVGGGLGIYHFHTENQIEAMNQEIVSKMFDQMDRGKGNDSLGAVDAVSVAGETEVENQDVEEQVQQKKESLVPEDGREYIGIIEVQELGIRLPVLKRYTDADMKTTPCVYYGSRENDNLVIVGHNYDSQFGNFNKLDSSQEVNAILTLLDGTKYYYKSKQLENLNPSQIDEMLSGDWDMTLFTCSYSGEKRIALRFDLVR